MTAANRRLAALRTHLHACSEIGDPEVVGHAGGTARAVVREHARGAAPAVLFDDARMKEFVKRGVVLIPPDAPGMPPLDVHDANWADGCTLQEDAEAGVHSIGDNIVARIPGIRRILESAAVRGALQSVLGEGYTYHPHHFMHMTSPGTDQFWHKDSGARPHESNHRACQTTARVSLRCLSVSLSRSRCLSLALSLSLSL